MTAKKKKTAQKVTKFCQYSKKLSTAITVIWCILRFAVMATSIIRPEIADAMVSLITGADTVMMVNIGMYSGNSFGEKAVRYYFDAKKVEYTTLSKDDNEKDEETNG